MKTQLLDLDAFLNQYAWLWREQPFKICRPSWCGQLPELTQALLSLADSEVSRLERDPAALLSFLQPYLPELEQLEELCGLPLIPSPATGLNEARFGWEVPGRKRQQIEAFSQAISTMQSPVLEWCGGKGHLGRSLALLWQQPVETVEWDPALCEEGRRLSARAKVQQVFHVEDALAEATLRHSQDKHVVALHACGDLHRRLVHAAGKERLKALDFAPCCYHLGRENHYQPFNKELQLQLSRDDLRLSVTNSDTAPAAQLRLRDQEMAWKLGYECLRQGLQPDVPYQNIKPINKAWLKLTFAQFCAQLAAREGLDLSDKIDWAALEQQGWQRQCEVMRLNLLRFVFRRALEVWLVLDMASWLQQQGYTVTVQEFCTRAVTPRNIVISVRDT